MIIALMYVALIAGVNWAFAVVPLVELPGGDLWSPVALVVGFVFVARDFAQRAIGHHVLWAMLAGCLISWIMASPALALASAGAFAIGELADWCLYTFTRKPFSQRILYSSLLGAPLDSLFFLSFIGIASFGGICVMSASKLLGAFLVFYLVRRRERIEPARAEAAWARLWRVSFSPDVNAQARADDDVACDQNNIPLPDSAWEKQGEAKPQRRLTAKQRACQLQGQAAQLQNWP